jgi:hypothetical protein
MMPTAKSDRADPFDIDLSGFEPTQPAKPKIEKAVVRQVSEANNFPSRAATPKQEPLQIVRQARRRRTGRNVQFNIKTTPETIVRFTALADKNNLVFGELLDRALDAFEQLATKK